MSQYRTLNRTVLCKEESSSGTDASPTVGSNAVLVENPNSNLQLNTFDTNEVTGALDARAPIPSTGNAGFSGRVYLHGSGAAGTTLPEVDPFLKACGFSPTAFAAAVTGTAQAGASSTITLAAGASATNDFYRGTVIVTTGGTGSGQTRQIKSYVGSTKVATVTPAWSVTPDNTTTYSIAACHIYKQVSSSIPTVTIYEWLHRTDGGNSKLRAQVGCAGTFTLAVQSGQGCYFDFQMTGSLVQPTDPSVPSAATSASAVSATGAPPSRGVMPSAWRPCSAKYCSPTVCHRSAVHPDPVSSVPSSSQRRRAHSSTRRNNALRTIAVNARWLAVSGLGGTGTADVGSGPSPAVICSHSSSRLESTWRTSSPSHSTISVSSSVRAAAGTPERSALNASER